MHNQNAFMLMQACIVHAYMHIRPMSIVDEITKFEESAKASGLQIGDVLEAAGVDRSTWTRWKSGKTKPLLESWRSVEAAAAYLRARTPASQDDRVGAV